MATITLPLTVSTTAIASKTCNANGTVWANGTNRLDWTAPIVPGSEHDPLSAPIKAMYLQRSTVDNNRPRLDIGWYQKFITSLPPAPDVDSFWTTIKEWHNSELDVGVFPTSYSESVPHSTFYFYRLIFFELGGNPPAFGFETDWNVATIVQPFDLSICQVDLCPNVIPQGCRTLLWDAPVLTVPFITGTHVGSSECGGANGCFKIHVNWTYTPTPTSYDVYKSNVGPDSLGFAANTATSPLNGNNDWYDSDANDRTMWYQLRAIRPNGSVINSNIVQISY